MRLYAGRSIRSGFVCPESRVGSHRTVRGLSRRGMGGSVRGLNWLPSFSRLAVLRLCSLARPQDSSGSDSFVHPFPLLPLLPFLLPLSNYLLVSSPAGRSFFEKTTRARTRPTHSHKKSRSPPHPNRRYSSTFVCISPSPHPHTRSSSANTISFLKSSNSHPHPPLHVPNLLPFPVIPTHCLHISRIFTYSIRVVLNLYLTSHSFSLNTISCFLALLTFSS
jgi:hypothetical protein